MNAHLTGIVTENREQCLVTMLDITERKLAEDTLYESHEDLYRLLNSIYEGAYGVDVKGNCTFVNRACLQILGYQNDYEFLGKHIHELIHHSHYDGSPYPSSECRMYRAYQINQPVNIANEVFWRKDGVAIPVEYRLHPIEKNGVVIGSIVTFIDITDRKRAEESLIASETRYRRLFESAKDGILILDAETGMIMDVNPFLIELLGYSEDQFIEKEIWEIGFFKDIVANHDKFLELKQKKYVRYDDLPLETADGRKINVEFVSNVYLVDKKKVIQCNIRDITKRKQAELALRNSETHLRTLVHTIPDLIWLKDTDGVYLSCNTMFERFFGAREADIVGKTDYDYVDRELADFFRENDRKAMAAGKPTSNEEWVTFADDGHRAFLNTIKTPMYNSSGTLIGVLGIGRDLTERKRAEEALRESEAHFKTIFNEAPLGIALIDSLTGYVNSVNPMFAKIADRTVDEMTNIEWMSITHPDHVQEGLDNMALLNAGKISGFQMEKRYLHHDGTPVWINMTIAPIYVEDKAHPRHLCMIEDITKRKKEEEALRRSEAIQAKMVANIGDVIVIIDKDGINRYKSPNIEKWFGWSPEEVVGVSTWENVHPEDVDSLKILFGTLVEKPNATETTEIRYRCKDGSFKWIEFTVVNLLDDPDIRGLLGNYHDITERKHTAETLRISEERYRFSLEITGQIGWSIPPDGLVEDVPLWRQYTGQNIEEVKGWKWLDSIHPDDREHTHNIWVKAIAQKCKYETEYRIRRADGVYRYFMVRGIPLFNTNGSVKEWVGTCIDITERKHAEKELIEAKEKAEESDRLKSAFLANMSHEVRTPLNSIIGFSELLADPDFEEEQKDEFIQHIITSGNNLLSIISDIMDISKMESGEITIRNKQINARNFISTVTEKFSSQTEAKKLELKLTLPDNDKETAVFADSDRLSQVFNNLISNAIKFTENGSIEIGYHSMGTMVKFYVKDTGIGIPAEFHRIIFERFRQVEAEKNRKYGGNGLGLAISKNLVELMGGEIWFESESGKGSTFYFTLPAYNSEWSVFNIGFNR